MHEQNLDGVLSSVVHFCRCGNLGLRILPEVGMSSTMFSMRRLYVPGPVCNPMSFHSICLSMSILPRPCLSRFDIIRCIYTTSASFMPYLFEGVSIVSHLRSVPILPGCRGYVQKLLCWSRGMDEQVLEVRNIYQDCKFFSLGII
jgi:hypothetical protein